MTRRDYVLLADVFHTAVTKSASWAERDGIERVIMIMCNRLSADNPRFDSHRFYDACFFPEVSNVSTETTNQRKSGV